MIEHNLDVIRCADWIIDLGPDGGGKGGKIVMVGTPETVTEHPISHTGKRPQASAEAAFARGLGRLRGGMRVVLEG